MGKQFIELTQVGRLHVDVGRRRRLLLSRDGRPDRLRSDRLAARHRQPQRIPHGVLTVVGRQLQDLEVFAGRHARAMLPQQLIVGHAKVARGKHVRVVLIVLQGPGLANQRVDDVPVVDGVLAVSRQAGHGLNLGPRPPDFDLIGVDYRVDGHPDQAAGDRVRVAANLDRAAAMDLDSVDAPPMIELARRQLAQTSQFLSELIGAARVPLVDQLLEELLVLGEAVEVAAAAEVERLIHRRLQVAVRRLDVAVLMRLAGVRPLRLDLIVVHQVAVPPAKLALFRQVVDRRAQAVAAMPAGHAAQLPKGVLDSAAHGLERFGEADGREFPVRVGEGEVVQQVVQRLAPDGDSQRVHVGEVRRPQPARIVDLGKHDGLPWAAQPPPVADAALQRPALRIGEPARPALLEPGEEGERPQPRFGLQSGLDFRPHVGERVGSGSPGARPPHLRGQALPIPILTSRLLIHACLPCRRGQAAAHR